MGKSKLRLIAAVCLGAALTLGSSSWLSCQTLAQEAGAAAKPSAWPLSVNPPHISTDKTVKYDYPVVYVRAPKLIKKKNNDVASAWPEFGHPTRIDAGYDLMLLHPNGNEEVLVPGGRGAVTDPFVSFDGESVYYSYFHDPNAGEWTAGADIYRIHVKTRKIVRLTSQQMTPNTGVADWVKDYRTPEKGKTHLTYAAYNLGPCPLPGGKVMFTSNRDGVEVPRGYPQYALQLYVMDDDGRNVEKIGHLNVAGALHPVILADGRVLFSSLESQGIRGGIQWGIWSIHPDGTNWEPIISAFHRANGFHFQTQLSDGSIVIENYYNQNNRGFGTHLKLPPQAPEGVPAFGPALALKDDPKMRMLMPNGRWGTHRLPFKPYGLEVMTRFATFADRSAGLSDPGDAKSPRVGKVTHPSGAPDNHLLTVWTPGATPNANGPVREPIDAGIYLIKGGKAIDAPGEMLRIKHDPKYNAQWPRALVSYKRIYGVGEPRRLPTLVNDGKRSPHLPEGTPFGLIGSSSLYKRESFPGGVVPKGSVTSTYRDKSHMLAAFIAMNAYDNWTAQGSDAGLYDNSEIHGIRILAMEPATSPVAKGFFNLANERLRILGEFPVRKFLPSPDRKGRKGGGEQPLDPDGNPDTSFLAKIPADTAFTFQMIDKHGMNLTMAQTWHQVRPGEARTNCGGCHSHSQRPTLFEQTAAAKPDYKVWDLTAKTPLLTSKAQDETGKKWDTKDESGVRFAKGVHNVEYWRDVRPILDRSCAACHTKKSDAPAAGLVLDGDDERISGYRDFPGQAPGTYFRLALDSGARLGGNNKPLFGPNVGTAWRFPQASRYIVKFQSRRSLLIWNVFGQRTDGLPESLRNAENAKKYPHLFADYTPKVMPPPTAVAGTYTGPDGTKIKVAALTDEDRLTLVRWIDLGCPIDMTYDGGKSSSVAEQGGVKANTGHGWMLDDQRPTLALTYPRAGVNPELSRILIGMHDYYSGLDVKSFQVVADFRVDGTPAGKNLASQFKVANSGVWELKLNRPITELPNGKLTVSVRDRQGNITSIERTFSVR
jgi:hypothetical protein